MKMAKRFIRALFSLCVLAVAGATMRTPIRHVVVLMEENRSFDHLFGFSSLKVNKLKGDESNPISLADPTKGAFSVKKGSKFIGPCDPCHGLTCTTSKLDKGAMDGFVAYENSQGHGADEEYCGVMEMFDTDDQLPVISFLAREYAIMDNFFASVPGPTWPNRLFALTGTSAGATETGTWFNNTKGRLYPQRTIFDSLEESSLSWKTYYHDLPWNLILESVVKGYKNLWNMETFFQDAAAGNLPSFSWINPRLGPNMTTLEGSNDQHPDHDMRLGERLMKDVYEALRASPAWNETLFIITYDEHGGFYDHVSPPSTDIPSPGDGIPSYPEEFSFDRLGIRIPTILVSPWIERNTIISAPSDAQKPFPNSEFELTSIPATVRKMFGLQSSCLTARSCWAATFEDELLKRQTPRSDCPMTAPDAPSKFMSSDEVSRMKTTGINDLQADYLELAASLRGMDVTRAELKRFMKQSDVAEFFATTVSHVRQERKK